MPLVVSRRVGEDVEQPGRRPSSSPSSRAPMLRSIRASSKPPEAADSPTRAFGPKTCTGNLGLHPLRLLSPAARRTDFEQECLMQRPRTPVSSFAGRSRTTASAPLLDSSNVPANALASKDAGDNTPKRNTHRAVTHRAGCFVRQPYPFSFPLQSATKVLRLEDRCLAETPAASAYVLYILHRPPSLIFLGVSWRARLCQPHLFVAVHPRQARTSSLVWVSLPLSAQLGIRSSALPGSVSPPAGIGNGGHAQSYRILTHPDIPWAKASRAAPQGPATHFPLPENGISHVTHNVPRLRRVVAPEPLGARI
ncbi:hypothetical protein HMN09_01366800 [Mycena chlorophos]|uniref:Uncharacterized protein n=1 Tax=Mycena chlorophos TaxID=658473 RepID=A0A8H6RXS9_MYCCL|nr:hypothetical protein HMN09_01366800 [Mycena chlorophos]